MRRSQVLLLLPLLLAAPPALAQAGWHSQEHSACLAQAAGDPEGALERARRWEGLEGGAPARHCLAVAMIGVGRYGEAAYILEALVNEVQTAAPDERAALLAEAGNAWMLANDLQRAVGALDAALELTPDNASLFVDRALALALAGDYWAAVDDLNSAEVLAPDRADVLLFRATAYRLLEVYELAAADLERLLALSPDNAEAYLERGNLRRLTGDDAGARQDWLKVLQLDPEGPSGEAARDNLEKLDVKQDG
jgi:tetratricopeptide (TPR) repeat protein